MSRPWSLMPRRALIIAAAMAAPLAGASAVAAQGAHAASASARASIVEPTDLRDLAGLRETGPGLARGALQVTVHAEPIPGEPGRREPVVAFD